MINYYLRKGFKPNKLYALYSGNLELIKKAWENEDRDTEWYKLIFQQGINKTITPIQSNVVKRITTNINDILYSKVEFVKPENIELDVEAFAKEVETSLQLFGEIGIRWSLVGGKYIPKIYVNDSFSYNLTEFSVLEHFYHHYYTIQEKGKDVSYKMTTTIDGQWEYNNLFVKENSEWKEVPLSTLDFLEEVPEEYSHPFETSFIWSYDSPLMSVIGLAELMDEALTYMSHGTLLSMPTTYIPQDVVMGAGTNESVEEQNSLLETIKHRACNIIKVPYMDNNYQKIDTDQPIIQVDNYIKVKDSAFLEILSNLGLSPVSFGIGLSSNDSGYKIATMEKQTEKFRDNLLKMRKNQFLKMFKTIGLEIDMVIAPFNNAVDVDALVKLGSLVDKGTISKELMFELGMPHLEKDQVKEELRRQSLNVGDFQLADIGSK